MAEIAFHERLALGVIATGVVVFCVLFFITAPYGRHVRDGWGPRISSRVGWVMMESPAALVFAAVYLHGRHAADFVPAFLACLWMTHYSYRAFVYPLRLRDARKPMPLAISSMAIVFNTVNGYLNARWLSELGTYSPSWFAEPRLWIGVSLFGAGLAVNVQSDGILLSLRKPGERGYRIPRGGAFRWISSPNYAAEIVEWAGWAVATWSLAGLAFFCFTVANLVPRAMDNHRWYLRTFADYPKERRAIVPGLW